MRWNENYFRRTSTKADTILKLHFTCNHGISLSYMWPPLNKTCIAIRTYSHSYLLAVKCFRPRHLSGTLQNARAHSVTFQTPSLVPHSYVLPFRTPHRLLCRFQRKTATIMTLIPCPDHDPFKHTMESLIRSNHRKVCTKCLCTIKAQRIKTFINCYYLLTRCTVLN